MSRELSPSLPPRSSARKPASLPAGSAPPTGQRTLALYETATQQSQGWETEAGSTAWGPG